LPFHLRKPQLCVCYHKTEFQKLFGLIICKTTFSNKKIIIHMKVSSTIIYLFFAELLFSWGSKNHGHKKWMVSPINAMQTLVFVFYFPYKKYEKVFVISETKKTWISRFETFYTYEHDFFDCFRLSRAVNDTITSSGR
jgi:hypothetical protein